MSSVLLALFCLPGQYTQTYEDFPDWQTQASLYEYDRQTDTVELVVARTDEDSDDVGSPEYSPSGRFIAFDSTGGMRYDEARVFVWDRDTAEITGFGIGNVPTWLGSDQALLFQHIAGGPIQVRNPAQPDQEGSLGLVAGYLSANASGTAMLSHREFMATPAGLQLVTVVGGVLAARPIDVPADLRLTNKPELTASSGDAATLASVVLVHKGEAGDELRVYDLTGGEDDPSIAMTLRSTLYTAAPGEQLAWPAGALDDGRVAFATLRPTGVDGRGYKTFGIATLHSVPSDGGPAVEHLRFPRGATVANSAISRDGRRIAFTSNLFFETRPTGGAYEPASLIRNRDSRKDGSSSPDAAATSEEGNEGEDLSDETESRQ